MSKNPTCLTKIPCKHSGVWQYNTEDTSHLWSPLSP